MKCTFFPSEYKTAERKTSYFVCMCIHVATGTYCLLVYIYRYGDIEYITKIPLNNQGKGY